MRTRLPTMPHDTASRTLARLRIGPDADHGAWSSRRGHPLAYPPFCTAADSFGAGQRMRTDQDDLRAVRLRSRCNVQVSPGHVVARRRPGYGPGMSRARGVHRYAIMRQCQLIRWRGDGSLAWNAGPDPRSGRPPSPAIQEVETHVRRN
jgi:hypothetical protein